MKNQKEIEESIPFIIATKITQCLGTNNNNNTMPKETKVLYTESYKILMKEIKYNLNNWRDIPCSWIGRINIVKVTVLLNAIYRFSAVTVTLSVTFLTKLELAYFIVCLETQKTLNSQCNLEKEG